MTKIEFLNKLLEATNKNEVEWDDISSTCFEAIFLNVSFIICKYFSSEYGREIGTFRNLDEYGMAIASSRIVWTSDSPEWESFSTLFSKLEEIYVL